MVPHDGEGAARTCRADATNVCCAEAGVKGDDRWADGGEGVTMGGVTVVQRCADGGVNTVVGDSGVARALGVLGGVGGTAASGAGDGADGAAETVGGGGWRTTGRLGVAAPT